MTDATFLPTSLAFAGAAIARADVSAAPARDAAGELRRIAAGDVDGRPRARAGRLARIDDRIDQMRRALSRLMRDAGAGTGISVAPGRSSALFRLDYSAEVRVGGAVARETASFRAWRDPAGSTGYVQDESRTLAVGEQSLSWRFSASAEFHAEGWSRVSAQDRIDGSAAADVLTSVEIDAISAGRFGARGIVGDIDAGAGNDRLLFDGRLAGLDFGRVALGAGADAITGAARSVRDLDGGAGDDAISLQVQFDATVSGGAGSDAIALVAGARASVSGGAGADAISVLAHEARVDGGEGADAVSVVAERADHVSGGAGDDALTVEGTHIGQVLGGAGDDAITVAGGEARLVSGGAGNDRILVTAERAAVAFAAGDGHDRLTVARGSTVLIQAEGDYALERLDDGAVLLTLAGAETLRIDGAGEVAFAPPAGRPSFAPSAAIDLRL